jgi:hypothetical protein
VILLIADSWSGTLVMPVHDWSRVFDGAFHDIDLAWIAELRNALNGGLLPPDYYAMAEQVAGGAVPGFLTLQTTHGPAESWSGEPIAGATAVAVAPPRVHDRESIEHEVFLRRQRRIVLRHSTDDLIVAMIDMPLFLAPGWYIDVPLEATYMSAWRGVPRRFRETLLRPVGNPQS